MIDLGDRFRMVVNAIKVVTPEQDLPKLPVARAVWRPLPDLETAAASWILAGGAHHMGFSSVVTAEQMEDFAEMAGMECLVIDQRSRPRHPAAKCDGTKPITVLPGASRQLGTKGSHRDHRGHRDGKENGTVHLPCTS